ncbi:hypothetical protein IF1G_10855 [Cordyceps javanica]|uniref:Azaphilone pigments biosynthesis cluster protein L N-terminal domain-containing protein n=1 Tax=Cordyceps javanica TaxID=43265 RepID=A0A545VJM0_9HYPO|nr:hypothetical protein IF1G_10855 [Cordyceps javanica]TQW01905.1 hypothetical protein IF2G_10618 [Cordyceps javanica]
MAEAIGVASGLVALATFACQSSVMLYESVSSFQSHQQRVRDLAEETGALAEVLNSLVDAARANPELRIPALAVPLKRCAKACEEFRQEIEKFSARSIAGSRTSFRDWARLKYMGEDVDGFRRLLSSYKMTISIALTNASLHQSIVTSEAVEGYTELLEAARADLEERLGMIDDKLEQFLGQSLSSSSLEDGDVVQIREERQSTENSLQLCAELSDHITRIQLAQARARSGTGTSKPSSLSERITHDGLQECKENLARMADKLAAHEKELFSNLVSKMAHMGSSQEAAADIARLRDELESARQSMNLVSSASRELEKSVSVIENHATGDAVQFMVSTNGQILHGTNRGLGWRTRQVGGHIDAETWKQKWKIVTFKSEEDYVELLRDDVEGVDMLLETFGKQLAQLGKNVWQTQAEALAQSSFIKNHRCESITAD